jgi:hypothetical protein
MVWRAEGCGRQLSGHRRILNRTSLSRERPVDQERRPEHLLGVLLDAYWTSLANDPLPALLLTGLVSLGGVLVVLLGQIVGDLVVQLARALS